MRRITPYIVRDSELKIYSGESVWALESLVGSELCQVLDPDLFIWLGPGPVPIDPEWAVMDQLMKFRVDLGLY